mgnify:CR=1 FL=1
MSAKLNLYNFAKLGVNVDKNPIQLEDGELIEAQNWTSDSSGSDGGIVKRPGLVAINSSGLSGSVLAASNVPLTAATTRTFYIARATAGGNRWITSTNEFTSASLPSSGTLPNVPILMSQFDQPPFDISRIAGRIVSTGTALVYPSGTYTQYPTASHTPAPIRLFDGTNDSVLAYLPRNPSVNSGVSNVRIVADMLYANGLIYIAVFDQGTDPAWAGRVLSVDPSNGAIAQLGERFGTGSGELAGGTPLCLAYANGFLWTGTGSGTSVSRVAGRVYRIRPSAADTTWTLDKTMATSEDVTAMTAYRGKLYVGTARFGSVTAATLYVRSTAGVYTSSKDTDAPGIQGSSWFGLIVFKDNLYAQSFTSTVGAYTGSIQKFNDTSWSSVATINGGADPLRGCGSFVTNGRIYMVFQDHSGLSLGTMRHSSDGTTWTTLGTNMGTVTGMIGVLIT